MADGPRPYEAGSPPSYAPPDPGPSPHDATPTAPGAYDPYRGTEPQPAPWPSAEPAAPCHPAGGSSTYGERPPSYTPAGPPPYGTASNPYQPAPTKGGRGCLKAFLIFLAIGVLLSIIGIVVLFVAANRLVQNFGTARPEDYELTQDDMTCTVTSGEMDVSGVITNKTDHNQEFRIKIDFAEGTDGPLLGEATAFTGSLTSGESMTFRESSPISRQPRALTCKVVDVSYFGP